MEISYNTLSQMARCPRRYELDKMELAEEVTTAPLYLGSTFHEVQHMYFKTRLAGVELSMSDLIDVFNSFWESEKGAQGRPIRWGKDRPDMQAELGRAMISAYYPYAQRIQPVAVEQYLTKNTPHALVYGTIDLLTTSGAVIDYKTSASMPYKTDIDKELQPTVYSFLLGGTVDFQYHYILKFKLPVVRIFPTKRYEEDFLFLENKLIPGVVKMIESGLFPPLGIATGQCRWCTYDGQCGAI